jgi:hypothetical protein
MAMSRPPTKLIKTGFEVNLLAPLDARAFLTDSEGSGGGDEDLSKIIPQS